MNKKEKGFEVTQRRQNQRNTRDDRETERRDKEASELPKLKETKAAEVVISIQVEAPKPKASLVSVKVIERPKLKVEPPQPTPANLNRLVRRRLNLKRFVEP